MSQSASSPSRHLPQHQELKHHSSNLTSTETLASRLPTVLASDADFCFSSPSEALVALGSSLNPSALADREQLLRHIEILTFHNQRMALAMIAHTPNGEELLSEFRRNHDAEKRHAQQPQRIHNNNSSSCSSSSFSPHPSSSSSLSPSTSTLHFDEAAQELVFRHMRQANVRLGMLYEKMRERFAEVEQEAKRNERLVVAMSNKLKDAEQAAAIGEGAKLKSTFQDEEIRSLRQSEKELKRKIQLLESSAPTVTFLGNIETSSSSSPPAPRNFTKTKNVRIQTDGDLFDNSIFYGHNSTHQHHQVQQVLQRNASGHDGHGDDNHNHNHHNGPQPPLFLEQSLLQCALAELEEEESSERQKICIGAGNVVALRRRILELEIVGLETARREEDTASYASHQIFESHRQILLLEEDVLALKRQIVSLERQMEEVALGAWRSASNKLQEAMAGVRLQIQERIDAAYAVGHRDGLELLATSPSSKNSLIDNRSNNGRSTNCSGSSSSRLKMVPSAGNSSDAATENNTTTSTTTVVGASAASPPTESKKSNRSDPPSIDELLSSFSQRGQHRIHYCDPISFSPSRDDKNVKTGEETHHAAPTSTISSSASCRNADEVDRTTQKQREDIDIIHPGRHHHLCHKPSSSKKKRRRSPLSPHSIYYPSSSAPPSFTNGGAGSLNPRDPNSTTTKRNSRKSNGSVPATPRELGDQSRHSRPNGMPPLAVPSPQQHQHQHQQQQNSAASSPSKSTPNRKSSRDDQQDGNESASDKNLVASMHDNSTWSTSAKTSACITPRNPTDHLPPPSLHLQLQQHLNQQRTSNLTSRHNSGLLGNNFGGGGCGAAATITVMSLGDMSSIHNDNDNDDVDEATNEFGHDDVGTSHSSSINATPSRNISKKSEHGNPRTRAMLRTSNFTDSAQQQRVNNDDDDESENEQSYQDLTSNIESLL